MANPAFRDSNGNNEYTWAELPVIPSDRADISSPLNVDRTIIEYARSGELLDTKYLTKRAKLTIQFRSISQAMVLSLQWFFQQAYIRLLPDADTPGTYTEVYIQNQFAPVWQPGGRYDLKLELRQYS